VVKKRKSVIKATSTMEDEIKAASGAASENDDIGEDVGKEDNLESSETKDDVDEKSKTANVPELDVEAVEKDVVKKTLRSVEPDEEDKVDKLDEVVEMSEEALVEIDKERARKARLDMAGNGIIQDARTFRLMYLEKCAVEASLQLHVQKTAYDSRIAALRQELNVILRQWETVQKQSIRKIADVRREIEEDYGIFMPHWGYDDDTGTLTRLTQDQIDSMLGNQQREEKKGYGGL
jgi:hypothetical protein